MFTLAHGVGTALDMLSSNGDASSQSIALSQILDKLTAIARKLEYETRFQSSVAKMPAVLSAPVRFQAYTCAGDGALRQLLCRIRRLGRTIFAVTRSRSAGLAIDHRGKNCLKDAWSPAIGTE